MDAKGFAVSLVIIILASAIRSGSTTPFESCSSSHFILAGEFLKSTEQEDCNITIPNDDPEDGSVQKLITEEGIMLSKAGSYSYQCQSIEGSITVVQLQHKVALCSNCTRQELTIQQNEVVHWTVIDQLPCANTHLFINGHVIDNFTAITGVQKTHFFNESGLYQLKCTSEVLLNINVTNGQSMVIKYTYMELIYTHGAIMAVSFGLMIPLGALMAHFKKSIIHMIIQPLAIILTCLGFILAVVYTELNNNTHFNQLHSILGLIILIIAMLILPGLKLSVVLPITKKGRKILTGWHKRLGTSTVFFGIFNIFLGLLALPVPYYVTIVYGMWVALIVIIYVMSGLIKKDSVKTNEDEESILTTCCRYRSDQIDLSRRDSPGPTKLSKDLVSHEKFILARKKSIDMVEMTEVLPEKNNVPPQRKKSNVQFGPVAASLISPPPPDTPQSNNLSQTNVNQFGFVDKYSSSDYSSSDDSESDNNQSDNGNDDEIKTDQPKGPFAFLMNKERLRKESQASLRITRHSDRAHTKLADVFQRSNSIVHDPLKPSPLAQSLERDKCVIHINDKEEEEEKQTKEASPITPPEEKPSGGCPFHNTEETNLPLQQRRMRRHGIMPEQPQTEQLELPDDKPIQRSVSINSSFRRKQQNIVDQTLKSVMSMSDDAIICANAQGEVVFWSAGAVKMFGYTPREAIGSSLQMIMPTRYKEKHQNGINGRTDRAIEYIKKHNTAPEEQKHARLYSVSCSM
jgi:PAS domain-containing protein